jgi:uncharacterized caspase-like protein
MRMLVTHRQFSWLALVLVVALAGTGQARAEQTKPNLVVLAIGVSKHQRAVPDDQRGLHNLKYAAKDARDLAEACKAQEGKRFSRVETMVLTDREATRQNIEEALDRLARKVGRGDHVIVFVSGHGGIDNLQHYFFVPYDYDPARATTGVRWTAFRDTLARLPGTRFLILDTCRAGGAGGDSLWSDPQAATTGLITYASSLAGESSLEAANHPEFQNGYFTLALLEALQGKADSDQDGVVTLAEIDAYVSNRVARLSGGKQNPAMQRPASIPSSLALARVSSKAAPAKLSPPSSSGPLAEIQPPTTTLRSLPVRTRRGDEAK